MTHTFTPEQEINDTITQNKLKEPEFSLVAEPSEKTLNNILLYSKNLEVKSSSVISTAIEFIRS